MNCAVCGCPLLGENYQLAGFVRAEHRVFYRVCSDICANRVGEDPTVAVPLYARALELERLDALHDHRRQPESSQQ